MFRLPASILYLLLCLQVIVPAQLWHELCDHHDTHSCQAPQEGLSISEQHVHCLVLELTLPGMIYHDQDFEIVALPSPCSYGTFTTPSSQFIPLDKSTVRGPPAGFLIG